MAGIDEDELLAELGIEVAPPKAAAHTPREERIIAGFEDIVRFHQAHGRAPRHGEDRDIFERLYAVRLDRLRQSPEARALLAGRDKAGLLAAATPAADALDEDMLLAELEDAGEAPGQDDIRVLRHVRSHAEKKAAEEIAERTACADFEAFQPLFEQMQRELRDGQRKIIQLETRSLDEIRKGTFFVVGGQFAYVAEEKGGFTTGYDRRDMRLRVVYDNGTESDVLQRSLQRALHRDKVARLVSDPHAGPLFGDAAEPDDIDSGTIYVLRSRSGHPFVAEHRELIHKIGVTGGKVETRIAGAENDATYLLAGVDVVATYKLHNLHRVRLENLFHRLFAPARLELVIEDRFGHAVKPQEWFLVPLAVIDEAVERIRDGTITDYAYDTASARLAKVSAKPAD